MEISCLAVSGCVYILFLNVYQCMLSLVEQIKIDRLIVNKCCKI